jgi:hypothetical protein
MDRYEASWQLLISYLYGLLVGSLIFLSLAAILTMAARIGVADVSPGAFIAGIATLPFAVGISVVGGAILGVPILLLAWLVLLVYFERIHAHLRAWCILAPIAVGALWLLGELGNAAHVSDQFGSRAFTVGAGPRVALAVMCAAFASMRYYRAATSVRSWGHRDTGR